MTQAAPTPTPPKKAAKQERELLTKLLRHRLTDPCPPSQLPPAMQAAMSPGQKAPTYGDAIVFQLMDAAMQGREWAIEQVLDRTEGKPVQAVRQEDVDRTTNEMLNDVTTQLLNKFAANKPAAKSGASSQTVSSDPSAGSPATRLLHLSKNGASNPQDPPGKSGVAAANP